MTTYSDPGRDWAPVRADSLPTLTPVVLFSGETGLLRRRRDDSMYIRAHRDPANGTGRYTRNILPDTTVEVAT